MHTEVTGLTLSMASGQLQRKITVLTILARGFIYGEERLTLSESPTSGNVKGKLRYRRYFVLVDDK
jgi:hypothetical protein